MAASDTPDVPPIPVPPIEPAPKAKAAPAKAAAPKATAPKSPAKPATPAAKSTATSKPAATPAATDRPNPYAQPAPAAPQPYVNGPYVAPPSQGLSITSMVLGIVGALFSFCYGVGFLFSVAAVITGHIASKRERHAKGFWLTGIITGYAGIGLALLVWVAIIVIFALSFASAGAYSLYN